MNQKQRKFKPQKRSHNEILESKEIEKHLGEKIKKYEEDDKENLDSIASNNILIANFRSYQELKKYIEKNPQAIKYATFGAKNIKLEGLILNKLSIVANNEFNELITGFWGVDEETILKSLKLCKLDNPPKSYGYKTVRYANRNNDISGMCFFRNTIENRNELNLLRNQTISKELNKEIKEEYSQLEKLSYLSKVIFKKYIMLFYDIKNEIIEFPEQLYIYNYYLECLDNKRNITHKEILEEANNILKQSRKKLYENKKYMYCVYIYQALRNMFNSKDFQYKSQIDKIKDLFKDEKYFRYSTKPEFLFIKDLMKLQINFDFYQALEYYNEQLPEEIKTKYELRYYQSKLINDYKEILRNKLNNLKKIENPTSFAIKKYKAISSFLPENILIKKNNIPEGAKEERERRDQKKMLNKTTVKRRKKNQRSKSFDSIQSSNKTINKRKNYNKSEKSKRRTNSNK